MSMGVESAGREFNVVASAGADIEAEAAVEDTLNGFPIRTGPFHLPGSRATVKLNQGLTDERLIAAQTALCGMKQLPNQLKQLSGIWNRGAQTTLLIRII